MGEKDFLAGVQCIVFLRVNYFCEWHTDHGLNLSANDAREGYFTRMAYGGAASYDDRHSPVFFHAYRNLLPGPVHLQPRRQVHGHRREKGSKEFCAARVLVLCDGSGRSISREVIPEGLERVLAVCIAGHRDMYFVSTGIGTAGRRGAAHQETNAAFIINCYFFKAIRIPSLSKDTACRLQAHQK